MTFTIQQTHLSKALTICGKAVSQGIDPLLQSYLFKLSKNSLEIVGSNGEMHISKTMAIDCNVIAADICLPSSRLLALIKDLPDQPLTFTFEDNRCDIKAISGIYKLPYIGGELFPDLKIGKQVKSLEIESANLFNAIDKTIFAVHNNTCTPFYGLSFEVFAGLATFTACNMMCLASVDIPAKCDFEARYLLSPKCAGVLQSILDIPDIKISTDGKVMAFQIEPDTLFKCALMDMKFTDWRKVIPTENDKVLTVDKGLLLGSVRRVDQFCHKAKMTVMLDMGIVVNIQAQNELSEEAKETISARYIGESLLINLNGKMLIACLPKIGDTAEISFSQPNTAAMIKEDALTFLIMPYFL